MLSHDKVLIIGKVWPEPKSSAAGTRMMQLIYFFKELEAEIVFASTANPSDFQEDLSLYGIETYNIQLNSVSFDDFLIAIKPSVVVFDRFMTEEQFGWRVIEHCPAALRILNSEDLHFLRHAREEALKLNGDLSVLNLNSEMALREVASMYRVDFTFLVSEFEIELLREKFHFADHKMCYFPLFSNVVSERLPNFEQRRDFMFIGNFLHAPNWDALCYLKREIWPLIRKKCPQAQVNVYGAYASQKVMDFHNPMDGFLICGRVEDAQAVTLKARVSLAPLRFGAGIKGKLLEAMACGTPTVTTSIGAESMQHNDLWNGAIVDSAEEFAEAATQLYTNPEKWELAQQNGVQILAKRYNYAIFVESLKREFRTRLKSCEATRSADFLSLLVQHHSLASTKYLSKWIEEKNKDN